jgi:folate-dependent phosphoribosylglycinamide formyltransferase PurN
MANVLGKLVSDGSHNIILKQAEEGEVPNVIVDSVTGEANVRFKMAGVGEVPSAIADIITLAGFPFVFTFTLG